MVQYWRPAYLANYENNKITEVNGKPRQCSWRECTELAYSQSKHRITDRKLSGYLHGLPGPSQCTPQPTLGSGSSLSVSSPATPRKWLPSLYGRSCCLCQALTPPSLALDLDLPLTKAITRAPGLSLDPNLSSKPLGTCRLKKFTPTQGHTFVSMRKSNKMRRQRNTFKQNSKIKPRKNS